MGHLLAAYIFWACGHSCAQSSHNIPLRLKGKFECSAHQTYTGCVSHSETRQWVRDTVEVPCKMMECFECRSKSDSVQVQIISLSSAKRTDYFPCRGKTNYECSLR